MIAVTGNGPAKMLDWIGLMKNSHILIEVQSQALAEVMITLVAEGFNRERDPYGRKWAKKKKPDGRMVLHGKTSRLRNGWHVVSARRRGFHIAASVEYAAYHQAPRFNRRPARMMVPTPALGIPKSWQRDMTPVAIGIAKAYFSGGTVTKSARALLNMAKARAFAKRMGA
jgi:phage gpG-like protein